MRYPKRLVAILTTAAAAGTLAACSNEPETATTENMAINDSVAVVPVAVPVETMQVTLTPEQQTRRDALDQTSYYRDVRSLEDQYRSDTGSTGGTGDTTGNMSGSMSGNSMAGSDMGNTSISGSTSGNMGTASAGGERMDTTRMSFEDLDRNDDGKLSVAEFAIYAVGLDPNAPKPNDATKPYASADQLNRAADGFFYYDTDGDTYLSQSEFQAAKQGSNAG